MTRPSIRRTHVVLIAASILAGCAQTGMVRAPAGAMPMQMQMQAPMDEHMKRMQQMHERMAGARTPAERQSLMTEHHRLMQEGMGMMSRMHRMDPPAPGTPEAHRMMEMRMRMMESMMQMMMDRVEPAPQR